MRPAVVLLSVGCLALVSHLPVEVSDRDVPDAPLLADATDETEARDPDPTEDDELAVLAAVDELELPDREPAGAGDPPAIEPAGWTARARVTAYCLSGRMRSGRYVYPGAIATDRAYIPEGSLVAIEGLGGVYVSEDTGSEIRGWWIDLYMPSCVDARRWGNQQRAIRVQRWGW